jgi:hypothetical protein
MTMEDSEQKQSENNPLIEGVGAGALVAGVGAATQALWEHKNNYRERLKEAYSMRKNAEEFFWWDKHHTPEWKALIVDPMRQQSGVTPELIEAGNQLAIKEINTITNNRIALLMGTAVAAVVFGGLVYAHARQQQEESQATPSLQIEPQGVYHTSLKEQPITPERT